MSEHFRSLFVILFFAVAVFSFARPHICAGSMAQADFTRRRKLWFVITLAAFLANSFWLFVGVAAFALRMTLAKENNKVALFLGLLLAIPPFAAEVPAFGIVNYLFSLNYIRLLSLVILLPAFLALRAENKKNGRTEISDTLLLGFLGLAFCMQLLLVNFTSALREGFVGFLDMILPYYVASRGLRTPKDFRDAIASFVLAATIIAPMGVFEVVKHWLLYSTLDEALGLSWDLGGYLARGDTIRAVATAGQSIALGFVMLVACGLHLYLRSSMPRAWAWWLGMCALIFGLLAPMSRGPWVGAVICVFVFLATGPAPAKNLSKFVLGSAAVFIPLLLSPYGDKIIERLPFVGTLEAENFTYRQRLLELSLDIIRSHPWFGAPDYQVYLEELRQGSGLIDVVNSYLAVALSGGLVGLSIYVSFFAVVVFGIAKAMWRIPDHGDDRRVLGRVLFATFVAILVVIFSVSSITFIPTVYWSLAGMGVAYVRMLRSRAILPDAQLGTVSALRAGTG